MSFYRLIYSIFLFFSLFFQIVAWGESNRLSDLTGPQVLAEIQSCASSPDSVRCMIDHTTALNERLLRLWPMIANDPATQDMAMRVKGKPRPQQPAEFQAWLTAPGNQDRALRSGLLVNYIVALDSISLFQEAFQKKMTILGKTQKHCIGTTDLQTDPTCQIECRSTSRLQQGFDCMSPQAWMEQFPDGEGTLIPADHSDAGVYNQCSPLIPDRNALAENTLYSQIVTSPPTGESEKMAAFHRVWTPILHASNTNGLFNAMRFTELVALRNNAQRALGLGASAYIGNLDGLCSQSQPLMHYWTANEDPDVATTLQQRSAQLGNDSFLLSLQRQAQSALHWLTEYQQGAADRKARLESALLALFQLEPLLLAGTPIPNGSMLDWANNAPSRLLALANAKGTEAVRKLVEEGMSELGIQYLDSIREACNAKHSFKQLATNVAVRETLLALFPEYRAVYDCLSEKAASREQTNQTGRGFAAMGICLPIPALCTTSQLWTMAYAGDELRTLSEECKRAGSLCGPAEQNRIRQTKWGLALDALTFIPIVPKIPHIGTAVQKWSRQWAQKTGTTSASQAAKQAFSNAEKTFFSTRRMLKNAQQRGLSKEEIKKLADSVRSAEQETIFHAWQNRIPLEQAEKQYATALERYRNISSNALPGEKSSAEHLLLVATAQKMAATGRSLRGLQKQIESKIRPRLPLQEYLDLARQRQVLSDIDNVLKSNRF